jgi:hypothetical protein
VTCLIFRRGAPSVAIIQMKGQQSRLRKALNAALAEYSLHPKNKHPEETIAPSEFLYCNQILEKVNVNPRTNRELR